MSSFYDLASLVMIPSGKKAGKVYSQKPLTTDGQLDFTRASTATRIGSDGLIEKTRTNQLLQSNTFNTTWTTSNSSVTSGQAGYDGTNNAWLLTASNTSSARIQQTESLTGVQVLSVYAKAGTANFIVSEKSGTNGFYAWFDLSNGTIGNKTGDIDAVIEDVGQGWYRCSISGNPSASSKSQFFVCDANGSTAVSVGASIYIQDAQVEVGLVATNVITTTSAAVSVGSVDNMPRLNYTFNSATSCPALLLEPQRTNLATQSEYIGSWTKSNGAISITDNADISPEGVQNASYVQFTAASQYIRIDASGSSATYTGTVYVKGTVGETIQIAVAGSDSGLKTLTGNYDRIEFTSTAATTHFLIHTFGGATARNIYVYGAQLEAGSYATSYIPTFGATVTRVADECEKTGISGLIGQTEGTLFADFEIDANNTNGFNRVMAIGDGTSNNRILILAQNTEKFRFFVSTAGVIQVDEITTVSVLGGQHKVAFAYKANDFVAYVDGVQIASDTSGTVPVCDDVFLGTHESGSLATYLEGGIKNALLFKTRLSNTQLADLTSIDS